MAKVVDCKIIDCQYSFYIKLGIRKGVRVYKAIESRNWYTVKHGLTHFENNEINKETVLGVFDEFEDAARAVGIASQQFINKIKEGVRK